MQDLKDVTEDVHYENFRAQCISQISQQAIRERGSVSVTFSFHAALLRHYVYLFSPITVDTHYNSVTPVEV